MSIKSDAYSLLKFIGDKKETSSSEIAKYFEFEKDRVIDALEYLEQKGFIDVVGKTLGGNWLSIKLSAYGVDEYEEMLKQKEQMKLKDTKIKYNDVKIQIKNQRFSKETLEQISRIEKNVNVLLSRSYREMTYKATVYPLIIASFIAIGFTSSIEFLKAIIPEKYRIILNIAFYVLILISIGVSAILFDKMRKNLDVDNYEIRFKIKDKKDRFNLATKLRNIFEKNEHQLDYFKPKFEGILINDVLFILRSQGTDIQRKENILKNKYKRETKEILYLFKFVNRRFVTSDVLIDIKNLKVIITLDKSVDFVTAKKILNDTSSLSELILIEKAGWDFQ